MRKHFVLAATTLAVVPALAFAQARPAQRPPAQQPRPAAPPAQRPAAAPARTVPTMATAHREGTWELGASVGGVYGSKFYGDGTSGAMGFMGLLRVGYNVNTHVGVHVGAGLGSFSGVNGGPSKSFLQPFGTVTYDMNINQKSAPFAEAGLNMTRVSYNSIHFTSQYGAHVGVGYRTMIGENLALRIEGRGVYDSYSETNVGSTAMGQALVGVSYFFGGKKIVTHIAVAPATASLASAGATQRMTATVHDQKGGAMTGKVVTWSSSNPQVATVNSQGVVTAVNDGSADIVATVEGVRGSSRVTVARTVNTATVTPTTGALRAIGRTVQFQAAGKDAGNQPVANAQFTWASSNPAVATVSPTGMVTAVGAGTANITATANGKSATAAVTVTQTTATVTVTPATANITTGATTQLSAAAADSNSRPIAGKTFTWASSSPTIATVSTTGLVTGLAAGAARITATADGQSGAAVVSVASAAAPPAPAVEMPRVGAALVLRNVNFVSNGATLTPASKPILDPIATAIVSTPNSHWEVGGYTDNRGAAAANRRLSQRRAQAVVDYLVSKGVPASQLRAVGYGSANPTRPNTTAAGRAANRRVEIKRID